MRTNKRLINDINRQMERKKDEYIKVGVDNATIKNVPQVYAVLAVALYENLSITDHEQLIDWIDYIFAVSQKHLYKCIENGIDPVDYCEQKTGISLRSKDECDT